MNHAKEPGRLAALYHDGALTALILAVAPLGVVLIGASAWMHILAS